jgi:transcription factor IIIB subunit 2
MATSHLCANCGPTEVEVDDRLGHTVCVLCGNVMEMNTIVSEVTFTEQGNGSAMADGFSVSSTSARAKSSSGKFGLIRTGGQEPREQTMMNGHRRISEIASQPQIRMAERHIQSAQRFFNLAVMNNFTKGRKSGLVVAACLYVVCRMEKTAHMLIDFADALSVCFDIAMATMLCVHSYSHKSIQVNVFQIGATFLKLVQLLHIPLPIVDPSLYITRFADRLDYGDKTPLVVKDANRLAQRMNRDWLQTGRRPAGICAASKLVALYSCSIFQHSDKKNRSLYLLAHSWLSSDS